MDRLQKILLSAESFSSASGTPAVKPVKDRKGRSTKPEVSEIALETGMAMDTDVEPASISEAVPANDLAPIGLDQDTDAARDPTATLVPTQYRPTESIVLPLEPESENVVTPEGHPLDANLYQDELEMDDEENPNPVVEDDDDHLLYDD